MISLLLTALLWRSFAYPENESSEKNMIWIPNFGTIIFRLCDLRKASEGHLWLGYMCGAQEQCFKGYFRLQLPDDIYFFWKKNVFRLNKLEPFYTRFSFTLLLEYSIGGNGWGNLEENIRFKTFDRQDETLQLTLVEKPESFVRFMLKHKRTCFRIFINRYRCRKSFKVRELKKLSNLIFCSSWFTG